MGATEVVDHGALAGLADMSFARILCAHDTDAYFDQMTRLVAPQGMICSVVGLRQPQNLMPLFQKSAGFVWEYMFTRSTFHTGDMARQGQILARIAALMADGTLRSTRRHTIHGLSAETLQAAHDRLAGARMTGKLVITL
jgi:NADPH:quinone reductase